MIIGDWFGVFSSIQALYQHAVILHSDSVVGFFFLISCFIESIHFCCCSFERKSSRFEQQIMLFFFFNWMVASDFGFNGRLFSWKMLQTAQCNAGNLGPFPFEVVTRVIATVGL